MNDALIRRIAITGAGLAAAIFAGVYIASGSLGLLSGSMAIVALWVLGLAVGIRSDALVAGIALIGYIVGNRGFAQLMPPSLPLLPGEFVLGVAVVVTFWRWGRTKVLPVFRESLNFCILAWIVIGSARIAFDMRANGFVALRDFAMVYYALFFYLAQGWADEDRALRWLHATLAVALVACAPAFYAFQLWPDWFLDRLTINGIPLVYPKSDVVGGFMAGGAIYSIYRSLSGHRALWLAAAGTALAGAVISNSRAALVALAGAAVWLVVLRQWRAVKLLAGFVALGVVGLAVQAVVTKEPFQNTPLYRIYESGSSMLDFSGQRVYQVEGLSDKPDNNQFRMVWWRAVADETLENAPVFGLGFGYDIARDFVRVYYADANDDFNARSPHNFFVTILGRMGIVGCLSLAAILFAMGRNTIRAARLGGNAPERILPLWLVAWSVLITACFGVVLEGPMGAIVFWTVLGLANRETRLAEETEGGVT